MKLIIVGADAVHAIENFYVQHIASLNKQVIFFPATTLFHEYYYRQTINKLIYRAGLSSILNNINRQLKDLVEAYQPDCIWVFKGMEIFSSTLHWAKQKGIKLANYNPDNPFIFTGRGSGNKNITASLPLYDLHFTYSLEIKKQLEASTVGKVVLLPFAHNVSDDLFSTAQQEPEIVKACFVGNPDKQRAIFLEALANKGLAIDVFGNHWERFVKNARISVHVPVYDGLLWKTLARYRVQLNIMRIHNVRSHNMRSFEVPAIGGIMLAPDTPEHHLFFEAGQEVFLYTDVDDCVKQTHQVLAMPKEEANQIRFAARRRCLQSKYSYADRAAQVIQELNKLLE